MLSTFLKQSSLIPPCQPQPGRLAQQIEWPNSSSNSSELCLHCGDALVGKSVMFFTKQVYLSLNLHAIVTGPIALLDQGNPSFSLMQTRDE